jgi:hypothetical protein
MFLNVEASCIPYSVAYIFLCRVRGLGFEEEPVNGVREIAYV